MFGTQGQKVADLAEACEYIRGFIRYEWEHRSELAPGKEHDFDLYLPWLMEIVVNAEEEVGSRPPAELDVLYMEAGWHLVTLGYLRPGPRRVSGDSGGDGYGKGFSLTTSGSEWVLGASLWPASQNS